MAISVFDLFKIGIGPSSSHTVGPMVAARQFVLSLPAKSLNSIARIDVALYGSLGATGKGHGTDKAVLLGLMGETPETVDVASIPDIIKTIKNTQTIILNGIKSIGFDEQTDLIFHRKKSLPKHENGLQITAFDTAGNILQRNIYYSVGGGFVVDEHCSSWDKAFIKEDKHKLPYPFSSAEELLQLCKAQGLSISQLMMKNEQTWRSPDEVTSDLLAIWQAMQDCVEQGCKK